MSGPSMNHPLFRNDSVLGTVAPQNGETLREDMNNAVVPQPVAGNGVADSTDAALLPPLPTNFGTGNPWEIRK